MCLLYMKTKISDTHKCELSCPFFENLMCFFFYFAKSSCDLQTCVRYNDFEFGLRENQHYEKKIICKCFWRRKEKEN